MAASANRVETRQHRLPIARALQIGVLGGLLAAVGNVLLYFITQALLGINFIVPALPGGQLVPLTIVNVVLASFIPGLAAGLLLYLLTRISGEAMQIFLGIAVSILLFSFTMPMGAPGIPFDVRAVLAAMHLIAAGAIMWMVTRFWNR